MIVEQLRLRTGVVEEKKFIPHLTVAKYRIPSKQQYFLLQKNLAKQKIDIELEVKKMVLFQTVVQAGKSVYKKVRDFDLL
jgi:2'-5' RNA ligase